MEEVKPVRLRMHDVATIVAWHHNMSVTDDQAYVALLRVLKFVQFALEVLERHPTVFGKPEE